MSACAQGGVTFYVWGLFDLWFACDVWTFSWLWIFHIDPFVCVCQLVLLSQLPCSLLSHLFITLSKQNGYRGGAQALFSFFFFLFLGLRTDPTSWFVAAWALPAGCPAEMISLREGNCHCGWLNISFLLLSAEASAHVVPFPLLSVAGLNQSFKVVIIQHISVSFPASVVCWHTLAIKRDFCQLACTFSPTNKALDIDC